MNCYVHNRPAVGTCAMCGRGACRDCVAADSPHLICRNCQANPTIQGFEYRSEFEIAGLPLVHICAGVHPITKRPRVARGVIAIGNIAVGVIALGGVSIGLVTLGGLSLGAMVALGGAAIGFGLSLGGFTLGSLAIGGLAIGFWHAIGGAAFAPHVINAVRCDPETAALVQPLLDRLGVPPLCRCEIRRGACTATAGVQNMAEPRGRATDEDQEDREARRIEAAIQGAEDMRVWTGRGDQNGELDQEAERLVDARQRIKAETSIRPRKPLPKVSE